MKKLLVVLGIGLLFASCGSQPNLNTDTIDPVALKELKHGHVDTVLLVSTNTNDYQKYEYHLFKNDKEQTFKGSISKYNDIETGCLIIVLLVFVFGLCIGAILFNH